MSKSPSLRRIQADVRELALEPSDRYHASPLENDMFEWHFTIRGADGTDFEGGVYHGRIILPPEYPFKPPHILFLTPSGRFETNTKVCLSFSAYHPELWQPAWGIRLILEALISFLPTPADGAIGALDWTSAERKKLAKQSQDFFCPTCNCKVITLLPKFKPNQQKKSRSSQFQKEIEQLQLLQSAAHGGTTDDENEKKEGTNKEEKDNGDNNIVASNVETGSDEGNGKDDKAVESNDIENDKELAVSNEEQPKPVVETPKSTATTTSLDVKKEVGKNQEAVKEQQQESISTQQKAVKQEVSNNNNTPAPPSVNTNNNNNNNSGAAVAHTIVQENNASMNNSDDGNIFSLLIDPLLQIIIVLLAVICYLLIRKFQSLLEELEALD